MPSITPHLWCDHQAEEAARHYTSIFPNSRIVGEPSRYDEASAKASGQEPGSVMTIDFELDGQPFSALNGGPHFSFNESISFMVDCKDQAEVDHYWDRLGEGGDPGARQCGWLKDKFGVSWQIVSTVLPSLLGGPDPAASQRVMRAMLAMKKIDIAALEAARDAPA